MRVLLATNERSGSGSASSVREVLERHGAQLRVCDVRELDASCEVGDAERLVVAGGDGSLGPAAELAARHGLALGVVPTGTANDFARAAGLPGDVEEAAALAVDADADVRPYELARMDGRPFLNVASAGLSVVAAREAKPLKPRLGALAYGVGAAKAGVLHGPEHARVVVDGVEVHDDEAWQVVVAATGHFGGGSATGGTDPDDRELDVLVVPGGSRLGLARRAVGMKLGRLHAQDDVVHARGREVVVEGPETYNVDGEVCPCGTVSRFGVDDELVRVVVGR
ncbi:diacylglycerol kinase family protein [Conexibacter sp. SYSU D00693]|uniref:diacylglycerol/lipid kinase family protein n=1 Tax=Conexibacter sp. SYSU D00693 TaxID=2812560 RepID=UPI00196A87C9|nr:diacylglycerol kinase family protein [Conexibacter sp. SYSU D00693]